MQLYYFVRSGLKNKNDIYTYDVEAIDDAFKSLQKTMASYQNIKPTQDELERGIENAELYEEYIHALFDYEMYRALFFSPKNKLMVYHREELAKRNGKPIDEYEWNGEFNSIMPVEWAKRDLYKIMSDPNFDSLYAHWVAYQAICEISSNPTKVQTVKQKLIDLNYSLELLTPVSYYDKKIHDEAIIKAKQNLNRYLVLNEPILKCDVRLHLSRPDYHLVSGEMQEIYFRLKLMKLLGAKEIKKVQSNLISNYRQWTSNEEIQNAKLESYKEKVKISDLEMFQKEEKLLIDDCLKLGFIDDKTQNALFNKLDYSTLKKWDALDQSQQEEILNAFRNDIGVAATAFLTKRANNVVKDILFNKNNNNENQEKE